MRPCFWIRLPVVGGAFQRFPIDAAYSAQADDGSLYWIAADSRASVSESGEDSVQLGGQTQSPRPLGRDLEQRDGVDRSLERARPNICGCNWCGGRGWW